MDPLSFAYWLQGFVELHGAPPTPQQWEVIKEHLALVFTKVTTKAVTPAAAPRNPFQPPFGSVGDSILPGATYCAPVGEGGTLLCRAEPGISAPLIGKEAEERICSVAPTSASYQPPKSVLQVSENWPLIPQGPVTPYSTDHTC